MKCKIITGELVSASLAHHDQKDNLSIYSNIIIKADDGVSHKINSLILKDDLLNLFQIGDHISLSFTERKGRVPNIATAIKNGKTVAFSKSQPFIEKGPLMLAIVMTTLTIASVFLKPIISPIVGFYMVIMLGVLYYTYRMEITAQEGRASIMNFNADL